MKRRSARSGPVMQMMVSRTTLRMCSVISSILMCVVTVRAANTNNVLDDKHTTPFAPKKQVESLAFHTNATLSNKQEILSVGNELWDNLIHDCYKTPSISCFQKNVFSYLDHTLDISDVNVTNRLSFYRNKVDYIKYTPAANDRDHADSTDNEIPGELKSESAIEEVTDALYGKSVKFMMTHDVELKMPEILFDGATFRISPRSIEGNGAIVKLELVPRREIEARETGRIFKKKIQKFFKNKLLLSFLAIILVVKLIKIKLFWLLPIIVGVGTAKKLLLKFLLFLFPALSHLFKLCSYYQENYHQTKYHHHHHMINHHHTVVPPWYKDHDHHGAHHDAYHGAHHSAVIPNGPELIFTNPPKGNPGEYSHGPPHAPYGPKHDVPQHQHYPTGWDSSGPGLGSEYIGDINRNVQVDSNGDFKPKLDDANELSSWGLGTTYAPETSHSYNVNPLIQNQASFVDQKLNAQGPVYVPPQKTPTPVAAQIAAQYDPAINQQMAKDIHRTQAQVKEAFRIQAEQRLIAQQQKILQQEPFVQNPEPIKPKGYDPFYTPILAKIDKILLQLGFTDGSCKERLVCSMYKNPARFSPHSNFISAELSRDTSELQRPSATNPSVIRFYRFVQAARDGQDQRDCLRLYSQCSIATE